MDKKDKDVIKDNLSLLMSSFEKILKQIVILEKEKIAIDLEFKQKSKNWKEKHNGTLYKLTDCGSIYNLLLKRLIHQ